MCSVHPVLANLNNKSILALPLALLASTCMQALLARCCQGEMIHNLIPHAILPSSSSLTSFRHVLDQLLLPAVCISAVLVPVAMKTFSYPRSAKRVSLGSPRARFSFHSLFWGTDLIFLSSISVSGMPEVPRGFVEL